jgi:hypothetical protein
MLNSIYTKRASTSHFFAHTDPSFSLFKKTYLIDVNGKKVKQWTMPHRNGRHSRLLANGNLSINSIDPTTSRPFWFFHKYGGGIMGEVEPVGGKVIREYKDPLAHHDAFHYGDESGRILYTSLEKLDKEESAKVQGGVPGSEAPDGCVYADVIKEVDSSGNLLFEWKVSEQLDNATFPLQAPYPREHWPLINSVTPLQDGNILCSLRSVSAVIIISRKDKKIIWHLDNKTVAQQHCASELDNGNILLFDNGAFRHQESFQYTRAIEVDRETKKIVWSWNDPSKERFYSPFMGSAQRLQKKVETSIRGNTLICESAFGRIVEIDDEDNVCWEYINPYFQQYEEKVVREVFPSESNALFRAYKYGPERFPWLNRGWTGSIKGVFGY